MNIEITQQEAASLMNYFKEYDFLVDPEDAKLIVSVIAKVKPIAMNEPALRFGFATKQPELTRDVYNSSSDVGTAATTESVPPTNQLSQ